MRVRLQVRGASGIAANFRKRGQALDAVLTDASERWSDATAVVARQLVPVDTGRTQRAITPEVSEQGRTWTVYVDELPYDADGVAYYAPFVELGTSVSPAQPFLGPAFRSSEAGYRADVRRALQQAMRSERQSVAA